MTVDIRDARFYVVEDGASTSDSGAEPLRYDDAVERANTLLARGVRISVLYTEEASQMEITRFARQGIRTALVSGG